MLFLIHRLYCSYSDRNQTMAGQYVPKGEKQHVDEWMRGRPHELIKHCLHQKSLAELSDTADIEMVDFGHFQIRYYDPSTDDYDVYFGNEENMPYCTCRSWKSSAYLCKHFFLIFKGFPEWNWESVSSLYRNSPLLNLDLHFMREEELNSNTIITNKTIKPMPNTTGVTGTNNIEPTAGSSSNVQQYPDGDNTPVNELSKNITATKSLIERRKQVRILLSKIEQAIHLVEDNEELLETLHWKLKDALDTLKTSISK